MNSNHFNVKALKVADGSVGLTCQLMLLAWDKETGMHVRGQEQSPQGKGEVSSRELVNVTGHLRAADTHCLR